MRRDPCPGTCSRSKRGIARQLFRRGGERLGVPNSLSFHNHIDRVGGDILQHLHLARGPADLHGIDLRGGTEAKMLAQGVLREITSAGAYLAELADARSKNRDPRAEPRATAPGAAQLDRHAMIV